MKMVFVLISGPSDVGEAVVEGEALEVEAGIEDEEGLEVEAGTEEDPEDEAVGAGDESGKLDVAEVELINVGVSPDVDGHVSVCL